MSKLFNSSTLGTLSNNITTILNSSNSRLHIPNSSSRLLPPTPSSPPALTEAAPMCL